MSGIGWALGMERLLIALQAEGNSLDTKPDLDVYVMCLDEEARSYAFNVLTELRAYGYRAEMDYTGRSFKGQFKAVDRAKAHYALILGSSESQEHKITIKNTADRTQETIDRDDLIRYLDEKGVQ